MISLQEDINDPKQLSSSLINQPQSTPLQMSTITVYTDYTEPMAGEDERCRAVAGQAANVNGKWFYILNTTSHFQTDCTEKHILTKKKIYVSFIEKNTSVT